MYFLTIPSPEFRDTLFLESLRQLMTKDGCHILSDQKHEAYQLSKLCMGSNYAFWNRTKISCQMSIFATCISPYKCGEHNFTYEIPHLGGYWVWRNFFYCLLLFESMYHAMLCLWNVRWESSNSGTKHGMLHLGPFKLCTTYSGTTLFAIHWVFEESWIKTFRHCYGSGLLDVIFLLLK